MLRFWNAENPEQITQADSGEYPKSHGKWLVTIGLQGKRYYVGLYSDFNNAVKARLHIEEALHGGFIKAYQTWQRQVSKDSVWASENPFYFNVVKCGSDFHIDTVFENMVVSVP